MATSHHPMMDTQVSGVNTGMNPTVDSTSCAAGERPSGFKIPNQMKMMESESRSAEIPQRRMKAAMAWSTRSNERFTPAGREL